MTTSSYTENMRRLLPSPVEVVVPMVTAGAMTPLVMQDLINKSADQTFKPRPRMSRRDVLLESRGTYRNLAGLVGGGVAVQQAIKNAVTPAGQKPNIKVELGSSLVAAACTTKYILRLNARTLAKETNKGTMPKVTPRQVGAVLGQELTCFVGLGCGGQVAEHMQKVTGENKGTEYLSTATSAVMGSVFGHPFNTDVSRSQSGMPITWKPGEAFRGVVPRAKAVAKLSLGLKAAKDLSNAFLKKEETR